jgi:nitrogen-specific signal transduction histidine kinase/ActR/RegA family two-component response regulator
VENGPKPEQWVLVINDVTREREIQAQLQQQAQLATVGQLAAGIAHDFNNIIAVIVLYTQMGLRMPDVPPKLRARLEVVSQQAQRATDLIDQILDFGRRAVLKRQPMDLAPFLQELVKLLERTLPENIKVELNFGQDDYTINADPTRIQQAIMNLAINARDAMRHQGSGELRIDLARMAAPDEIRCMTCGQGLDGDNGAWVRITVTDNGSGIPPEALPHIFEPFFTTKEVGKGVGLGLSQVFGIVKQHGGHIDVTSQVGRGTTFTIYLPALQVRPPTSPVIERGALIQGQGETVLVVEDNATLRAAMIDILEMLNYRVLPAADGRAALVVLEQHADEIAVVLSDLVMPEMGGQALFHAMRDRGLTLPVVMLSGHPMERELEVLQDQGLAGWMLKPLDGDQLAQLLAQVLHKESEPS